MMRVLCALVFVVSMTVAALSAEINVDVKEKVAEYGENCLVAKISVNGNIDIGDIVKLKEAYAGIQFAADAANSLCYANEDSTKALVYMDLNSNGGSYMEALSILEWMTSDKRAIATYVDEGSVCYSACATIFLGGQVVGADGGQYLRRVMNPKAEIGFHAPFPMLDERNYSSQEVMDYFHKAFLIEHDFFSRAKDLGLSAEVAQFLMRPTIDDFYMIDRVGNALLLRVDVQSRFSFQFLVDRPYEVDANTSLNICANNEIVGNNGDASKIKWFFDWIKENKIEPSVVPSTSSYAKGTKEPVLVYIIPIQYTGEGMYRSCVVMVPTEKYNGDLPAVAKPSCFGTFDDDGSLSKKILLTGIDSLSDRDYSFCRASGPLAGQHFTRKLSDLTPAELGE